MIETVKIIAQVTSTLIAVVALIIALRNEARNQKRFDVQLSQSKRFAQAAARPILTAERESYEDEQAIVLANHGPGTAIVSSLRFSRRGRHESKAGDLLDVAEDLEISWIENTEYGERASYIAAKSSEDAFRITADRLEECGVQPKRALELIEAFSDQLDEMEVSFEYEDIFGKKFRDTYSLE